ncbi:hypothetical protein PAXRUDRAFT_527192 [Paxillus rubicundulus Ve08.2h10]|uniref:Uncharacterized protein n=1 Tax=Paxillus rubicundulus Ve08.2h10 TaxID=930991 RepID=A0A0D0D8D1_9AGAM|nr:hypothetical protein PAXRUDRAFT_527192 [Paxillus rubicundulus Ve08.2h10]
MIVAYTTYSTHPSKSHSHPLSGFESAQDPTFTLLRSSCNPPVEPGLIPQTHHATIRTQDHLLRTRKVRLLLSTGPTRKHNIKKYAAQG